MRNAEWMGKEIRSCVKDAKWCDDVNSSLKDLLPKLVGVGDLTAKLIVKLKPQVEDFASKFLFLLPKDESASGAVLVEDIATEAAKKDDGWIALSLGVDHV